MPYSGGSPVVERWRRSCRRSSLQAYQRRPTSVRPQGVLWFGPVEGGYACLGSADRFESLCQNVSPTVHIKEAEDTATPERIDIIISSLSILIQPYFAIHAAKSQIGTQ